MRSPRPLLASLTMLVACSSEPATSATDSPGSTGTSVGTSDEGPTSTSAPTGTDTSSTPTAADTGEPTGEPTASDSTASDTTASETTASDTTATDPTESDPTASDTSTSDTDDPTGSPLGDLILEETFNDGISNGWVRVERWRDPNAGFVDEDRFALDQRAAQTGQRLKFFGSDPAPDSGVFLLYYAPGWDVAKRSTPVLLAHGANDQADRAWANPGESGDFGCGQSTCPDTGLMQSLSQAGYSVFAVSHPHSQGDNYYWAEQVHDAISIIRDRTGAAHSDVIGWSKGVLSTRMYASSLTQAWSTPYAGDIRRLVLIGGPNLGFDYIFRYGTAHDTGIYADFGGKIHAPGPHDELLIFGVWSDRSDYAIYKSAKGDNFRGQLQMLARWDAEYPLTATANNGFGAYAVIDSKATYYGEGNTKGTISRSKGIDVAIDQGSVIADMVAAGIPAEIETFLLCGDLDLADNSKLIPGIPNEIAGPSDGIVLIDSCAAPDGIGALTDTGILKNVNHLQLGWHAEAVAKLTGWLGD